MNIQTLTPDLARKHAAACKQSWNGNQTCSIDNMQMSCFASEGCNRGNRSGSNAFELRSLLSSQIKLVVTNEAGVFVGCVSANACTNESHLSFLFPQTRFDPGSVLLSNLCVNQSERGKGVARTIVLHLRKSHPKLYALIALPVSTDPDVRKVMTSRAEGLKTAYGKMGFAVVGHHANYLLLKHTA